MKYHEKEAVAYCGICGDLSRASLNDLLIGRRFICPGWSLDFPHIGVVVKKKELSMLDWFHLQRFLVCYSSGGGLIGRILRCLGRLFPCLTRPAAWLPWVRDTAVANLLVWAISLLIALTCLVRPHGSLGNSFALVIASAYIADALLYNTSVAFVTQLPRLPLRTAILTGIAFLELSLAFAVLYLLLPKGEIVLPDPIGPNGELDYLSACYFSLVTIVTLGYGDIHPCLNSRRALGLTMAEISVGLYFLSILFAVVVSWANQSRGLPTLCEILEESENLDEKMRCSVIYKERLDYLEALKKQG